MTVLRRFSINSIAAGRNRKRLIEIIADDHTAGVLTEDSFVPAVLERNESSDRLSAAGDDHHIATAR